MLPADWYHIEVVLGGAQSVLVCLLFPALAFACKGT